MAAPIEKKVQASTGAAAVSGLALWALGHYAFKSGVPDVVASWVYVLIPAVITFGAGYLAKHTDRPPPVIMMGGGGGGGEYAVTPTSAAPAEKTLMPPAAAAAEQPPAAAGPGGT